MPTKKSEIVLNVSKLGPTSYDVIQYKVLLRSRIAQISRKNAYLFGPWSLLYSSFLPWDTYIFTPIFKIYLMLYRAGSTSMRSRVFSSRIGFLLIFTEHCIIIPIFKISTGIFDQISGSLCKLSCLFFLDLPGGGPIN